MPLLNSAIQEVIAQYDKEKGASRRFLKEEPHMRELRTFATETLKIDVYKEVPKKDTKELSSEELLRLSQILLGKNTRDKSKTGLAFNILAEHFGSFAALDLLKSFDRLTPGFLVFLVNNPGNALALLRALLDYPLNQGQQLNFIALTDAMEPQDKLSFYEYLKKQYKENKSVFNFDHYLQVLLFLKQNKLKVPGIGKLLASATKLDTILHLLIYLLPSKEKKSEDSAQSVVFDAALVTRVMALKSPSEILSNLKLVECSPANLDLLFAADSYLQKHPWAEVILANFKKGGWVTTPYLKRILLEVENGLTITKATDILLNNPKLINTKTTDSPPTTAQAHNPVSLAKILDCIFKHPSSSELFAEAIKYLHDKTSGLNDADLDILISVPANPLKVAQAMIMLRKEGITDMRRVIASPLYAVEIASFEIEIAKWKTKIGDRYNWSSIATNVLANPESVQFILPVIKFCIDQQLLAAKVLAVSKAKLSNDGLSQLLLFLNSVPNLLNQINLELVVKNVPFIKTLLSATVCLKQGEKLDKENFESLLANSSLAVSAARELGGKAKPVNPPGKIELGAKNVCDIRSKAAVMAIGQKHNCFFKPPTTSKKYDANAIEADFKLKRRTTPEQARKDLLLKIVKLSGELSGKNVLEPEVLHEEALSSFNAHYGKK